MMTTTTRPTPAEFQPSPPRQRNVLGTAIQVVVLLLLLTILAGVVVVVLTVSSLVSAPNRAATSVTTGITGITSTISTAIQTAADPDRPPTGMSYDTELSALQTWHVGDHIADARDYVVSVQSIKRRDQADSADTALYAVVHAELRQPRETRLFGLVVRSDTDPHDYVVYKGETFRIGRALYRVNWISQDEQSLAAGTYRHPDAAAGPRKFEFD